MIEDCTVSLQDITGAFVLLLNNISFNVLLHNSQKIDMMRDNSIF